MDVDGHSEHALRYVKPFQGYPTDRKTELRAAAGAGPDPSGLCRGGLVRLRLVQRVNSRLRPKAHRTPMR